MPDRLTSSETSSAILFSCYAGIQSDFSDDFSEDFFFSRLEQRSSRIMLRAVLNDLVLEGFFTRDAVSGSFLPPTKKLLEHVEYLLSKENISVEKVLESILRRESIFSSPSDAGTLSPNTVPASDRLVSRMDNAPLFQDADQKLEAVLEAVRNANDLQATHDQRLAIISEIEATRFLLSKPVVRARAIYDATCDSAALGWLAKETGSGVVRALAAAAVTALLALIFL